MKRSSFVASIVAAMSALTLPALAAARKVYLASYSHLDASWRWPLQEGLQQSDATFRSALRTLGAFPDLRFSETSAAYYKWVRETDPQTFARVQQAVKAGMWEPIGSWWTEPDLNLVSGESLMRQAYYGRREFESSFGVRSDIAFLPDSFGSPANLPAILRAQGMIAYIPGRGSFPDGDLPVGRFLWQGLGESAIVTYNNPVSGGEDNAVKTVERALAIQFVEDPLVWFGLGDHGGGPSREALAALASYLREHPSIQVIFTQFAQYFKRLPPPGLKKSGEIEGVFVGAYANEHPVKLSNKEAERALLDLERFSLMRRLLGGTHEALTIDEQWQTLLLNQHHDTITGMSLRESLDEATHANNAVAERARELTRLVLEPVLDSISHTNPDQDMIAIFNPLSRSVDTVVEYPFALFGAPDSRHDFAYTGVNQFVGPGGEDISFQIAHADRAAHPGALRPVLLKVNVPAMGYTTVRHQNANRPSIQPGSMPVGQMQNEYVRCSIDPLSGQPASIFSQAFGTYAQLHGGELRVYDDKLETYASAGIPLKASDPFGKCEVMSIETIERGPVRQVVRVRLSYNASRIEQDWILNAGSRLLQTSLRIDWREPQKRLMLVFSHSMSGPATYDIPFGTVERYLRPDARPASSYIAFPAGNPPLALIGHALHAFWGTADLFAVSLVRSVPYAATELRDEAYTDEDVQGLGRHELHCALVVGETDPALLWAHSEAFRRTFAAHWVGVHAGRLPLAAQLLQIDDRTAVASARDDEHGTIIRIHDVSGVRHEAHFALGSARWRGAIDTYGIVTIRLAGGAGRTTHEI